MQCYRFLWYGYFDDDDDEECRKSVDISFGSNSDIAVSHFRPRANMWSVCIYQCDRNVKLQPSLSFYRKFDNGGSKIFVSFLHGCQVVTSCGDLIEITDFGAHGKITKSHRLNSTATCMSTKDEDIFVGFKSSEVVIFDSELVEKKSVTMKVKNGEWPNDLTAVPGKLVVCTNGSSKRALSFNLEDGRQLTEYNYERSHMYDDLYPLSITVSESLDLIGILWCVTVVKMFRSCEKVTEITLHSLSRGFCVSILNKSAPIVRFSPNNNIYVVSGTEDIEYSPVVSTFTNSANLMQV